MDEEINGAADAAAETTPALSLEETIANSLTEAYDKVEAAETTEPTGTTRDANGRFVSNTPAETAPDAAAPAKETTDQPAKATDAPAETPASGPPQSWSAAAKADWAKLPPTVQAEIAKRESDVLKGFEQKAAETRPEVEFAQAVRQRFEPFRQEMAQRGVNEVQAIEYLTSMEQFARRDPGGYIRHVAQELKVDLSSLVSPARTATESTSEAYVDPQLAATTKRLQAIEQRLANQDHAAATQRQTEAQRTIDAFKKDPANKHFDKVTTDMAVLIQSGRATDLKDAYEKAVWANPETRAEILAEQRKADEDKRVKEAEEAAKRARKAAGTPLSPRGSPATVRSGTKTIEQTMAEAYDRATGTA